MTRNKRCGGAKKITKHAHLLHVRASAEIGGFSGVLSRTQWQRFTDWSDNPLLNARWPQSPMQARRDLMGNGSGADAIVLNRNSQEPVSARTGRQAMDARIASTFLRSGNSWKAARWRTSDIRTDELVFRRAVFLGGQPVTPRFSDVAAHQNRNAQIVRFRAVILLSSGLRVDIP